MINASFFSCHFCSLKYNTLHLPYNQCFDTFSCRWLISISFSFFSLGFYPALPYGSLISYFFILFISICLFLWVRWNIYLEEVVSCRSNPFVDCMCQMSLAGQLELKLGWAQAMGSPWDKSRWSCLCRAAGIVVGGLWEVPGSSHRAGWCTL